MSLITRCPTCETMFKVVADQLKVAQGWVRCGYCGEVFNASVRLVPGDADALTASVPDPMPELALWSPPPSEPPQGTQPVQAPLPPPDEPTEMPADRLPDTFAVAPEAPAHVFQGDASPLAAPDEEPPQHNAPQQALEDPHASAPPVDALPEPRLPASVAPDAGESPARPENQTGQTDAASALAAASDAAETETETKTKTGTQTDMTAPAVPEVSFVRDARRKAFWKRPLVRGLLGLLSLALLTALLLQWVLQQKDNLAAMDPRLAPFLQTLCRTLDCEIRPPRHIESLLIDSSSFSKTAPDVYRLSFVLKNTSAAALEIPSLEITLTDVQEQALVRRILAPRQFGAGAVTLAAHAELAGAVTLKVAGDRPRGTSPSLPLPVNGYRILAFYP